MTDADSWNHSTQAENPTDADIVRAFLISVKHVRRRDGRVDAFDRVKFECSIARACVAYGLEGIQAATIATQTADAVMAHLRHSHNGHSIPSAEELRAAAASALIRLKHAPIANLYLSYIKTSLSMNPPILNQNQRIQTPAPETTARRRRLPDERRSITHKFEIGPHQGYITVGLYDDGSPGEIFLTMSKEGSILSGLVDAFATSISIGLQYGVPLKIFVAKFAHMRFEPSGETQNPNIPLATSIVDYIFRWLALKFLSPEERQALGIHGECGIDELSREQFARERQQTIGFDQP